MLAKFIAKFSLINQNIIISDIRYAAKVIVFTEECLYVILFNGWKPCILKLEWEMW